MATVRRPGPPVPPRPHAILLKTRTVDAARTLSSINASYNRSPVAKPPITATTPSTRSEDGRTVVYKSPSFNLQKRQEQREKRYSFNPADSYCGASTVLIERGYTQPPPLQLKPAVAAKKPKPTAPVPLNKDDNRNRNNNNNNVSSPPAIDNRTEVVIVANNNNNYEGPVPANPPQPKPRTLISKAPGGFLRRSKTTLDNFTRSTITIASISSNANGDNNNGSASTSPTEGSVTHGRNAGGGFMSGKTFDIKNNLKNAAERLFSEIVSHSKDGKYQSKTGNTHSPPLGRSVSWKSKESTQAEADLNGNCTRMNVYPVMPRLEDPIPPEKKIVFEEMLISELAAMRQRSSSVDQLDSRSDYGVRGEFKRFGDVKIGFGEEKSPGDDRSMNDSGTGSVLALSLNENGATVKTKRARQRCPSGCSTDSSPGGMEHGRIRTSDWIEVGENGKEEVMTSCQISLEDSGMEDEERPDDGSSGVGDSWDSVKEEKKEEERQTRIRARRKISMADLPPLPKSLSTNQTFNESNNENLDYENDHGNEQFGSTLGKQLAVLRKEMYGLRQLDISLLSQLWTLNDSIQNFRSMIDEQECYSPSPPPPHSPHSPSPSPYDSVSSDADDDLSPSIQTQIQHRSAIDISGQTLNRTRSASPTIISPTHIADTPSPQPSPAENPTTFTTSASIHQTPITTQPTARNPVSPTSTLTPIPTPTPRTPVKQQQPPPISSPRQINSKCLPPPPAPPTTKPPVERLAVRPSVHLLANNKLPIPVQRMRMPPPPPPVQRRSVAQPSRAS